MFIPLAVVLSNKVKPVFVKAKDVSYMWGKCSGKEGKVILWGSS